MDITALLVNAPLIVPVVAGLTEIVKRQGWLAPEWLPLLAVALGVAGSLVLTGLTPLSAFAGILYGLSASGLYDLGKQTLAGIRK